jgi:hypothetical protein
MVLWTLTLFAVALRARLVWSSPDIEGRWAAANDVSGNGRHGGADGDFGQGSRVAIPSGGEGSGGVV